VIKRKGTFLFTFFMIWKDKVLCLRTRKGSKPRSSG